MSCPPPQLLEHLAFFQPKGEITCQSIRKGFLNGPVAKKEEETVDEEVKRATRAVSLIVATRAVSPIVTEG